MANFAKRVKNNRTRLSAFLAVLFLLLSKPDSRSLLFALPLIIAGVIIRIWSAGHIHKSSVLSTEGPYSLSRNPLYVGSFILGTGFLVGMADFRLALVFFPFFGFVYWFTIRWEEDKLARRFPDQWENYAGRVPRFLPLQRIPEFKAGEFRWDQVFSNREHANALAAMLVYLILWGKAVFGG